MLFFDLYFICNDQCPAITFFRIHCAVHLGHVSIRGKPVVNLMFALETSLLMFILADVQKFPNFCFYQIYYFITLFKVILILFIKLIFKNNINNKCKQYYFYNIEEIIFKISTKHSINNKCKQ